MLPVLEIGSLLISTYDLFNALAFFAVIIFNLFLYRYKINFLGTYSKFYLQRHPKSRSAGYAIAEIVILSAVHFLVCVLCNKNWALILSGGGANYFGIVFWSAPIFLVILTLVRVNPLKQLDLFAPSCAVALIFFKTACFFYGCCRGKPWAYGLYYKNSDRVEFPSQLLELAVAVIILLVMIRLLRKAHAPGSLFPIYLILYSSTRFFTEFTREGDIVIMGLQSYQIQCIVGVLLGVVELMLIKKFGQRFSDAFDVRQEKYILSKTKGTFVG